MGWLTPSLANPLLRVGLGLSGGRGPIEVHGRQARAERSRQAGGAISVHKQSSRRSRLSRHLNCQSPAITEEPSVGSGAALAPLLCFSSRYMFTDKCQVGSCQLSGTQLPEREEGETGINRHRGWSSHS